jgi:hypothetical protein
MDADTIAKFFVRTIVLKVSGTTRYGIIPVDKTGALNPNDDPPAHLLYNLLERLLPAENLVTPSRLAAILLEHVGPHAQFVATTGLTHIVAIDIETDAEALKLVVGALLSVNATKDGTNADAAVGLLLNDLVQFKEYVHGNSVWRNWKEYEAVVPAHEAVVLALAEPSTPPPAPAAEVQGGDTQAYYQEDINDFESRARTVRRGAAAAYEGEMGDTESEDDSEMVLMQIENLANPANVN